MGFKKCESLQKRQHRYSYWKRNQGYGVSLLHRSTKIYFLSSLLDIDTEPLGELDSMGLSDRNM